MTDKSLTPVLQSFVARAAAQSPRVTGESDRLRQRHAATGPRVVLCDTSGSMATPEGERSRHQHLRAALKQVLQPNDVLIAFSSSATRIDGPDALPAPDGGTALEMGLVTAAMHNPSATLVISDGEPNVPAQALQAAEGLPGIINVLFCGDESNAEAVAFMRKLARLGAGRMQTHRWRDQARVPIAGTIRLLLAGPR